MWQASEEQETPSQVRVTVIACQFDTWCQSLMLLPALRWRYASQISSALRG
jgi:hypothetical protein